MTILNDIAVGFDNYPVDECVITLVDFDVVPGSGTGGSLNVDETWKFKVKIENTGNINMTSVVLHVSSLNDAHVSETDLGPTTALWTSTFISTGSLTVNAGGSQKSKYIYFRTPSVTKPAGTQFLSAHIGDWFGDWDFMFSNHTTHASLPAGTYSNQVFP